MVPTCPVPEVLHALSLWCPRTLSPWYPRALSPRSHTPCPQGPMYLVPVVPVCPIPRVWCASSLPWRAMPPPLSATPRGVTTTQCHTTRCHHHSVPRHAVPAVAGVCRAGGICHHHQIREGAEPGSCPIMGQPRRLRHPPLGDAPSPSLTTWWRNTGHPGGVTQALGANRCHPALSPPAPSSPPPTSRGPRCPEHLYSQGMSPSPGEGDVTVPRGMSLCPGEDVAIPAVRMSLILVGDVTVPGDEGVQQSWK